MQMMIGELCFEFGGEKFSGCVGVYYFEDDVDQLVIVLVVFNFLLVIFLMSIGIIEGLSNMGIENYVFFGELCYQINDFWVVEVGLCYDNESFDMIGFQFLGLINFLDCVVVFFIFGIGGLFCIFFLQ